MNRVLFFFVIFSTTFVLIARHAESQVTPDAGIAPSAESSVADVVLRGQPISLFDGKTLDGWEKRNGGEIKNWKVDEDGSLFRASKGGDLYHKQWFRDFDLRWDWKLEKNGNSGVKYRVQGYGNRFLGCEYQLQADKGNRFGLHSAGALYALYPPGKNKKLNEVGQWNSSRIVVSGYQIEHWLNGKRIMTATVGSADWHERVRRSKFKPHVGFGENREGRIFLQDHGNPVWFRNIVVTPLDSSQPALSVDSMQR